LFRAVEQILAVAGIEMHFVAELQQKRLGVEQAVMVELRHGARVEQAVGVRLAMLGEADPPQQMQVA
jgi:hypothetical protein